ncbi:MAG: hypothetical protein QOJ29_5348 [Thermoleophilaceae bacterium]|jgi:hypothetical protein|nr:hypothetical protein [Thermoleophilaceae bacterium]
MTATSTSIFVYTRTNTAVFLSDVILGSVADILAHLGIDSTRLQADWDTDQAAIKAWIEEESLAMVVLECTQPSGKVAPVIEFPVSYGASGLADQSFTNSRAALARYRAKLDSVPRGTTFRLVCTFRSSRTPQPGWSPTTRASTAGLSSTSFGTLATGPHASTAMRYLR